MIDARTVDAPLVVDARADDDRRDVSADAPDETSPLDAAPRCADDVDPLRGQGSSLGYPLSVVRPLGGFDDADAGAGVSFAGRVRWEGFEALDVAVRTLCSVGAATEPPCEIREALVLTSERGARMEIAASVSPRDLADVTPGSPLTLRVTAGLDERFHQLSLTRDDGVTVLAIVGTVPGELRVGGFVLAPVFDAPVCVSAPQPTCRRLLVSVPLRVSPGAMTEAWAPFTLAPMESRVVATASGRYRVTHRATVYSARSLCAAPPVQYSQFELVRVGES